MSDSEPAAIDPRITAAADLAEQQIFAALVIARRLTKSTNGHLNFNNAAAIGPILRAIAINMSSERPHA